MKDRHDIAAIAKSATEVAKTATEVAKDTTTQAARQARSLIRQASHRLPDLTPRQKLAAGVGLAAATAAGVAALVHRKGSKANGGAVYHLAPNGGNWELTRENGTGTGANFPTKQEGLNAAREMASQHAPSELVVHRADGSEQVRHRYSH
jgi:hypothetical protein